MNNQPKLPQESPFHQSKRPHWRDFRRFERPKKEPGLLPKEPGVPLGQVIKRLWFPMLLLPLTIFIAVTYSQRPWNIFPIPIFEPSPEQEAHPPASEAGHPRAADKVSDDALLEEIPSRTLESPPLDEKRPTAIDGCVIGGCSSEICAQEEMFSTCTFRPESICYGSATCERQLDGSCDWTQTPELATCLENYR